MKNTTQKTVIIAVLILGCMVVLLIYGSRINSVSLANLLAAETQTGYLPVVLSHTPPTETAVPTLTSTATTAATGEPTATGQATTAPSPSATPSNTPETTGVPSPTPVVTTTPSNTPAATTTASPTASPTAGATPTATQLPGDAIVVNHHSIDLFEEIPETYLVAAANLRMLYIDRSVGANIDDGLTCLTHPSSQEAPNHCTRYEHVVPAFSVDPSVVSWQRPGGYERSQWHFLFWDENADCNQWQDQVRCFIEMTGPVMAHYDVVSFQFSYLEVAEESTIADQPGGYFWDTPGAYDVFDQEAFEAQHPDKIVIYWTTSLARGIGSEVSEAFNEQMRQYAIANGKPLFDVAAILSHDPDGHPCYDNRDGIPYDNGNNSENYPDDGLDLLAICQHYTTETDGGHLGSVSGGKIRVAKAFWVLMARLAGWDGTPQN